MTTVRCKFRLDAIKRQASHFYEDGKTVTKEVQALEMTPVYGNGDPNHENTKFFAATPYGKLEVGTVNAEAVKHLVLGAEYYVDITPADTNASN